MDVALVDLREKSGSYCLEPGSTAPRNPFRELKSRLGGSPDDHGWLDSRLSDEPCGSAVENHAQHCEYSLVSEAKDLIARGNATA